MRARIGHLVDDEIERLARVLPDEIVDVALVDDIDVMDGAELVDERGGIVERIRRGGGRRAKPRDPHDN
jgi:hypothetical protein